MVYAKGTEDWCFPEQLQPIDCSPKKEVILVTVYPDCKLFIGVDHYGTPSGWGKVVWVKCSASVPKFKARFYDSF